MLSICIPVYNFEVTGLVRSLHAQASKANITFEIRCYDDGSSTSFKENNQVIKDTEHVIYRELPENLGRSKIRNLLAREASYEFLLFMDCDSEAPDDQYIQRYVDAADAQKLIYGGRSYHQTPPTETDEFLRWHYGCEREVIPAARRQQQPHHNFMTNNFLIPKPIFEGIGLDESLKGYGHEDTLFGIELKKANIPIVHIDNPLHHIGLEGTDEFLRKTEEGIRNLHRLIQRGLIGEEVKLSRFYLQTKRWGLAGLIRWWYGLRENAIRRNLRSKNPALKKFDFLKLAYLLTLDRQSQV